MNGKTLNALAVFFFLFFAVQANAIYFVKVVPKSNAAMESLYLDEVKEFNVIASNTGTEPISNLVIEISTEKELALIDAFKETKSKRFELKEVLAGETLSEPIKVKALSLSEQRGIISASYGINEPTELSAAYVVLLDSPLQAKVELKSKKINKDERGYIYLTLTNEGSEPLKGIKAYIESDSSIIPDTEAFSINSLQVKESSQKKEFSFMPSGTITGKKDIVLTIEFVDSNGLHFLQKNLEIEIEDRITWLVTGTIVLLLVILLIVLFRPKGKSKRMQDKERAKETQKEMESPLMEEEGLGEEELSDEEEMPEEK